MATLWLIIKGMFMGISNIIPGVSGGTMAVSLGIYDDLIFSVSNFFSDWKKSLKFLLPLGIGLGGGVVFFAYAIELLLTQYVLPTTLAFIGLILGGLPILYKDFQKSLKKKKKSISTSHVVVFILFLILVAGLSFIQEPGAATSAIDVSFSNSVILFFVGIITAATLVVPGISGSLILMILGYYYSILNTLTTFFDHVQAFNWEGILNGFSLLFPFGIGVLLGVFLISKVIEYLFIHFPSLTYSGVLGLVVASPVALIYNTGVLANLSQISSVLYVLVGIALFAACFYVTYQLSMKDEVEFRENT